MVCDGKNWSRAMHPAEMNIITDLSGILRVPLLLSHTGFGGVCEHAHIRMYRGLFLIRKYVLSTLIPILFYDDNYTILSICLSNSRW